MPFFNCKVVILTFAFIVFLGNLSKGSTFAPLCDSRNLLKDTSNKLSPLENNVRSSGGYAVSFSKGFTWKNKAPTRLNKFLHEKKTDFSEDNNEPKKLILGEEIQKKIMEIKSKYPTTEAAYLEAAKNRAVEYQKKKELGLIEDGDEVLSSEALLQGSDTSVNFGPEDLSNFKGFTDEGWEASLKQNDMASLISGEEATIGKEKEENEAPKLLIFDSLPSDNEDGDIILLI